MSEDFSRIMSLLFSIGRKLREQSKFKEKKGPFSYLQFETLRYVRERKNPLMKDVANYLCVTPPSATLLINSLVSSKMLSRIIDRSDRRAIRLVLTPKGGRTLLMGFKRRVKTVQGILSKLNAREQKDFVRILQKLLQS